MQILLVLKKKTFVKKDLFSKINSLALHFIYGRTYPRFFQKRVCRHNFSLCVFEGSSGLFFLSSETICSLSGPSFITWGLVSVLIACTCCLKKRRRGRLGRCVGPASSFSGKSCQILFLASFFYLLFGCNCSKIDMIQMRSHLSMLRAKIPFSVVAGPEKFQRKPFS